MFAFTEYFAYTRKRKDSASINDEYIEFSDNEIEETRELSPNIYVELDKIGNIVAMTIEHAKENANLTEFSFQEMPSKSAHGHDACYS